MPHVPLYNHVRLDDKPTGLYELVGHAVNGAFVRNKTVSPLRTRQQWQAIDQAQSAPPPTRSVSPTAALMALLTKDVPTPPTLRDIVNYQRRQLGAELLPDVSPALHTNSTLGVPPVPKTLELVVQLQREWWVLPPTDVREATKVVTNTHHKNGQCYRCGHTEIGCICPIVAPIVANQAPAPRREPDPMLCRHCGYASCCCKIETPATMTRVVARQRELRQLTN